MNRSIPLLQMDVGTYFERSNENKPMVRGRLVLTSEVYYYNRPTTGRLLSESLGSNWGHSMDRFQHNGRDLYVRSRIFRQHNDYTGGDILKEINAVLKIITESIEGMVDEAETPVVAPVTTNDLIANEILSFTPNEDQNENRDQDQDQEESVQPTTEQVYFPWFDDEEE